MRKIWLIATTTYRQRVRSGMFLMFTFGLPLLMIVAGAVPILTAEGVGMGDAGMSGEIGVVDQTGALVPVGQVAVEEALLDFDQRLRFANFPSQETAQAALQEGGIDGYLLIPQGYFDGEAVTYFADQTPGAAVREGLQRYLQRALLGDQPEWLFERLQDPAAYVYVGLNSGEEVAEGPGLFIRMIAPAVLALIFILLITMTVNQMGVAIIREKESRAMEMVVTSLRPLELVAGKVMGLSLLSLTQFAVWTAGGVIAATLALWGEVSLSSLAIPWASLLWGIALIIPAYFLFALLAAGMGIIAGTSQQAQQLAGLVGVLGLAPFWMLAPVVSDPNGAVAVGLTLFPLSAPGVALVRMIFGEVPVWQLAASIGIILLALLLATWFVAKIFRAAMLNYGRALRPRQIWQVLTQA